MCRHNEDDDLDCCGCAEELGRVDANEGLPYKPPYKNWDQCNSYQDGWCGEMMEKVKRLSKALDDIRDAVLHDRYQLEAMEVDCDITNAVIDIIDDHDPRGTSSQQPKEPS